MSYLKERREVFLLAEGWEDPGREGAAREHKGAVREMHLFQKQLTQPVTYSSCCY